MTVDSYDSYDSLTVTDAVGRPDVPGITPQHGFVHGERSLLMTLLLNRQQNHVISVTYTTQQAHAPGGANRASLTFSLSLIG